MSPPPQLQVVPLNKNPPLPESPLLQSLVHGISRYNEILGINALTIMINKLYLYPPDSIRWILLIVHEYAAIATAAAAVCRDFLVTSLEAKVL